MQKKNPLLYVLAGCGGCLFLSIIIGIIGVSVLYHQNGGVFNSMISIGPNIESFMDDIKDKDYTAATALIDPSVQESLSADKIQHMEEAMEKKLGTMQKYSLHLVPVSYPERGKVPTIVYTYQCTVTYQKGTATANLTFRLQNSKESKGLIGGFTLEPDAQAQNQ